MTQKTKGKAYGFGEGKLPIGIANSLLRVGNPHAPF